MMLWTILVSITAHHGEAANPDLLLWIKHRLDQLADFGPWLMVGLIGLVILAIPASIVWAYFSQGGRPNPGP